MTHKRKGRGKKKRDRVKPWGSDRKNRLANLQRPKVSLASRTFHGNISLTTIHYHLTQQTQDSPYVVDILCGVHGLRYEGVHSNLSGQVHDHSSRRLL